MRVVLVLGFLTALEAQPKATLTAMDYIEIQQLVDRYAFALDTCSNGGKDYADLYTADGVFIDGNTGNRWEGPARLIAAAGGPTCERATRRSLFTHTTENVIIEPSPEGAIGKSYLVYPGVHGEHFDADHAGQDGGYQDVYVKTPAGWRFKSRTHVMPPQIPGEYKGIPNAKLEPKPAQPLALTALDYAEIQQLAARYGHAIDTCSNNGYDYADLYTPDGIFIDKYTEEGFKKGGLKRADGREELARAAGGGTLGCKNVGWNGWSHLLINHVIDPAPGGATGRVYLVVVGANGNPRSIERDGGYQDVYAKTPAGWRFKSRTHVRTKEWHNPLLQSPDLN